MHTMRITMVLSSATIILCGAAMAVAAPLPDDDEANVENAAQADESSPLLAGPTVNDEPDSTDNPSFAGEDRMRQSIDVPAGRWILVLREVELSGEQREQVQAIVDEFEQASAEYRKAHAAELRALQERIRKSRETHVFDAKLREDTRAMQSKAPDVQPYQDRIWKLLDDEQQATFRAKLEEVRKQIADRRSKARDEQIESMRGGGGAMSPDARGMDERAGGGETIAPRRRGGGNGENARRGGRGMRPDQGLDEMSQRRFAFLMSKQSGAVRERLGGRLPYIPSDPKDAQGTSQDAD